MITIKLTFSELVSLSDKLCGIELSKLKTIDIKNIQDKLNNIIAEAIKMDVK